ncbi:MAG: galactose-1-phosphate uridylyltransferase [Acidobacteria bacterium]|nr:galactose-1-phosphate uridylyltransferase [Acidobacteriota bacterium]
MPELRKDPVTGRWVIIAEERSRRPSDFLRESVPPPALDGRICPFCPGQEAKTPPEVFAWRTAGRANEPGWDVRVVPNKFPALRIEGGLDRRPDGMFDRMNGVGAHEVIIETPDHGAVLSTLADRQIELVLSAFRERVADLKRDRRFGYTMLFKNHGAAAGASLEHSHSQLVALPATPKRVQEELDGARRYFEFKERCIFCDIVRQEAGSPRLVLETGRFLVIAAYAARFPFETWIIPKDHDSHFEYADGPTLANLAWVLGATLRKMERTLERPPYNFMIHTAPLQDPAMQHYHWHLELIPRLSRIAGFEWGSGFYINPTPPEEAAKFLRESGVG